MIKKGSEYGTMKETWHASLVEATRTAEVIVMCSYALTFQFNCVVVRYTQRCPIN